MQTDAQAIATGQQTAPTGGLGQYQQYVNQANALQDAAMGTLGTTNQVTGAFTPNQAAGTQALVDAASTVADADAAATEDKTQPHLSYNKPNSLQDHKGSNNLCLHIKSK